MTTSRFSKKMFSLFLAVVMIAGLGEFLPTGFIVARAEESGTCGHNLTWSLCESSLYISGKGNMYNYSTKTVVIDGRYKVITTAPWGYISFSKVYIEAGVTSIGEYAFSCCGSMSIYIPDTVTSIGSHAFGSGGVSVHINDIAAWNAVRVTGEPWYDGGGSYFSLYLNDKRVTNLVIPDSITHINNAAFQDFTSLESVTIPNSVTSIDDWTFAGCCNLMSVTIPNSVTSIGAYAFYCCDKLTSITIPDSVKSIGKCAFYSSCLSSLIIPDGVTDIGEEAFFFTQPNCVKIPDSVKRIGRNAFYVDEYYLATYKRTETVYVDKWLLRANRAVIPADYTIKDGTVGIADYAFQPYYSNQDVSMNSITIPAGVKYIGEYALPEVKYIRVNDIKDWLGISFFNYLSQPLANNKNTCLSVWGPNKYGVMTYNIVQGTIVIPDGVTRINDYAFAGYKKLSGVVLPDSVTSIGNKAFYSCNIQRITIPSSVTSIGEAAFDCNPFYEFFRVFKDSYAHQYAIDNGLNYLVVDDIESIAVTTLPAKTTYFKYKDALDVTGGRITLYYNDGTSKAIDMTADMVSGFDNTRAGSQTLTVTYDGKTATFNVNVVEKTLERIVVTTLPAKTSYLEGKEEFDVTGGEVALYYNDGSSNLIGMTASMVSGFDNTKVGAQTLTVTCEGKTATFSVTIVARTVSSIAVTKLPTKTSYLEGKDALDVTGGIIKVYYNNDTSETIAMTASMVSGFDNTKVGAQTLTVTCEGKTATFSVTIVARTVSSIAVTKLPTKTSYLEKKDRLDVTGGRITVYYNNGSSEVIDMTIAIVSGFDNGKVGSQTLTVTYGGQRATFDVTIIAKTLTGISLANLPNKLLYILNEDGFDVTGGKVKLIYNNGSSITTSMALSMISGFDNTKPGKQTLTVTCKGFTASFDVVISDSISAKGDPDFDGQITVADALAALRVAAKLTEQNSDMVTCCDIDGDGVITVADALKILRVAARLAVPFSNPKMMTGIAVTALPDKTSYFEAEDELDVTGGKVTLYYNNGTLEEIDMTADMVSGFDSSTAGTKTLTVTYEGKTTTFNVTINAPVTLLRIAVTTNPTKTTYEIGETLDVTGGKITLYYSDNSTEVKTMTASMVSGFNTSTAGTKTLTVTYNGNTATFSVTVNAPVTLLRIAVTTNPTKTTYEIGETLDVTGGKITLYYSDNSTEVKTMTASMVSGFSSSTAGTKTLTVTYNGKTTTFSVTVNAPVTLLRIAVTTNPTKTTYEIGETLDVTGAKITLYYSDNTTEVKTMTASMVSGFNSSTAGTKSLTVTYNGKTATFSVTVNAPVTLLRIVVTTNPTKTTYEIGETLDVTGGRITLYYDNETTNVLDMTESMVSGFNSLTMGIKTLTVTYNDKITTFVVEVISDGVVAVLYGDCGDGVTWTLYSNGFLSISGTGKMDNYKVSNNSPWGTEVKEVSIGEGVTSIGNYAFFNCACLSSVEIPDSVKSIGSSAFANCSSLSIITLPSKVKTIDICAFLNCSGLTSMTIPNSVTTIGSRAFSGCSGLTSITIPNSITSIVGGAFEYCTSLTSITIPSNVTSVGDGAFRGCSGLTSVKIPKSVTSIGYEAFYDCVNVTLRVYDGSYAQQYAINNGFNYTIYF